jgi:glutamate 5-kinase
VEGSFVGGDPVDVCDPQGRAVARGIVNYGSDELPTLLGRSTRDLARELGPEYQREVIHRDALVVL